MTRDEVKKVFKLIVLAYDRFEITPEKVDLWHDLLSDVGFDSAINVTKELIKTSKFPPTVSEIRKKACIPEERKLTDDELMIRELIKGMVADGYFTKPTTEH